MNVHKMEDASTQVCPLFIRKLVLLRLPCSALVEYVSTKNCNMMPLVDRICNDLDVTDSVSSLGYYDQQNKHLTKLGCSGIPVLAS